MDDMTGVAAPTRPAFEDRVGSVFAALGQPGWALRTDQGFKAGRDAAASSDDEQEASADMPRALPGAAESQQEEDEYNRKASCQYRQAFEQEEETDAYDEMAAEGLHRVRRPAGSADEPLLPTMEVLDDNAYDRHTEARRLAGQHASTSVSLQASHTEEPAAEQRPQRRVAAGSQVWVPPHLRPDFKPKQAVGGQQLPPAAPTHHRLHAGRGRGRAVPDHVRNPHKYTEYTFDEPVVVGGGIRGGDGDREMQQAAASAVAAAHAAKHKDEQEQEQEQERELPQFGAGIEFRPQAKRHQAAHPSSDRSKQQAAAAAGIGAFLQDDDDIVDAAAASAAPVQAHHGQAVESVGLMEVDVGTAAAVGGGVAGGTGADVAGAGQQSSTRGAGAAGRRRALRTKPAEAD